MTALSPRGGLFDRAVLRHIDAVYRFALSLTGNEADAEDLVQEVYLRAFRRFFQFRRGSKLKAWLFRIAQNAHIDRLRRIQREPKAEELVRDRPARGSGVSEGRLDQGLDGRLSVDRFGDEVGHALAELPRDFRLSLVLCDVEGFSYQEIAKILGCPVGTVRSRISRARGTLREKLKEYARDLGYARGSDTLEEV